MGFRKVVPQVIQNKVKEDIEFTLVNEGYNSFIYTVKDGDLIARDMTSDAEYKVLMVVVNNG